MYLHTFVFVCKLNREGESPCKNLAGVLLSFTQHTALGMSCLHMKQYIHRDLAARNILVSEDGLCKVCVYNTN